MIETTIALCNINSGSYNEEGLNRVQKELHRIFSPLSDHCELKPLPPVKKINNAGEIEYFKTPPMQVFQARPKANLQILFTGHSDTVFPKDSNFQTCWVEENYLRGPGTADMKGGLVILSECLRALNNSPWRDEFGFTVAISPDEEIGSPSSAEQLMALAQTADYGMTYEPALADGTLAGARKGSGNFTLTARGLSTHAGRDFFSGRNALVAIASAAQQMASLSDNNTGVTVNVGEITGGGPVNVVPDNAVCRFNVRVHKPQQQQQILKSIESIIQSVEKASGCQLELHGHFNRPPKIMTEPQKSMFELLRKCGEKLGLSIQWKDTGGCCEGNNLAAAGLLNIDTLGVRGGYIHSANEFAFIDSFVERAQLSALFITQLIAIKSSS